MDAATESSHYNEKSTQKSNISGRTDGIMEKDYLNAEHLSGFENYKYSCRDVSPLSVYVMHPFWNKIVEYCPKWVAPNLLTFLGFLFTFATFLVFTILDYDFRASDKDHPEVPPLPKWPFTLAAFNIFLAYTLDGIDGKQARRTGTSSPVGELFDHGLDSWSASLIPISMYSIFGRSESRSIGVFRMYYVLWNVLVNFYLSHWEKYNTGVLFLPVGYDFSMWGTILTFLVAGIWGYEAWQFTLPGGITAGVMFEILLYVSAIVSNLPIIIYNIYKSYRDRTGHMRSFSEAIRPLIPLFSFLVLSTLWVLHSPTDILDRQPRVLYFLTGTIFSNISCRLIVAQMSNTRSEIFNWLLLPTAATVIISFLIRQAQLEIGLTYALCVLATLAHIHYGACLVRQMCRHFRIKCFIIHDRSD